MLSIKDIPEMLDEMRAGTLTFRDVTSLCLDLFEDHEVEAVLAAFPEDLRNNLVADIVTTFDNNIPADDFLIFSSARGDHPAKFTIITKIRSWLANRNDPAAV